MARSRPRAGAAGAGASSKRQTKATSRKRTGGAAAVEVIEENEGAGIDTGIVVITFVLLVIGFLFTDYGLGKLYGEGMFFK